MAKLRTETASGAASRPKEHLGRSAARGSSAPPDDISLSTDITQGRQRTSKNTLLANDLQRTGKVYTEVVDREETGVKCGSNEPRPGSSAVERASYKRRVGGSTPLPATTSKTYYNENEPFVAEWLRRLVLMGLISPGDVDSRSIEDVSADDLRPYRRCHFFAGIGLWDLSLQRAGWPDEREVWTGSCPCQPFSVAGQGRGFDDARHLWPAWYRLVGERRPAAILGEQVGDTAGRAWLDLVHADLEMAGYAVAAANIPAAGVGAPHIRQRLWFVAYRDGGHPGAEGLQRGGQQRQQQTDCGPVIRVAHSDEAGRSEFWGGRLLDGERPAQRDDADGCSDVVDAAGQQAGLPRRAWEPGGPGAGVLADDEGQQFDGCGDTRGRRREPAGAGQRGHHHHHHQGLPLGSFDPEFGRPLRIEGSTLGASEPLRGRWAGADWIWCRDGKYRPIEPGTFPLAHGYPGRVGKLRAYGNAIVPQVAQAFIEAAMECAP